MTPVDFLAKAQRLRPDLLRVAQAITNNWHDAEEVVQEAICYSYGIPPNEGTGVHLYDETKASLGTYLTRIVRCIAMRHRRDNARRNLHYVPIEDNASFDDLAPYDPNDPSMKAVHDAGLPQVRLVEPPRYPRRAMRKERPGPKPEPGQIPEYDRALDVQNAMRHLPALQREAAESVFMQGYTEAEYAHEIGVSRRTVTRRCSDAKSALREILK